MSTNDAERNKIIRDQIESKINQIQNEDYRLMILGDFNGHVGYIGNQKLDKNGEIVLNMMEKFNLVLLNDDPKCKGETTWQQGSKKSTIDFVMVNSRLYNKFDNMEIDENCEQIAISDHNLIKVTFNTTRKDIDCSEEEVEITMLKVNETTKRKYIEKVNEEITNIDNAHEVTLKGFNHAIKRAADQTMKVKFKKKKVKRCVEPIWFNDKIKKEISKRREINKRRRKETNPEVRTTLWVQYTKQKQIVSNMVKEAVSIYENNITRKIRNNKNRGKEVWKHLNALLHRNEIEKKKSNIHSENGEVIEEEKIGDELKKVWLPVYQSSCNDIHKSWNQEEKIAYIERTNSGMVEQSFTTGIVRRGNRFEYERERRMFPEALIEHMEMAFHVDHIFKMNTSRITVNEVIEQIKSMKNGKATGPDEVKAELYKCLIEDGNIITLLTDLLNDVLETGNIPDDWKESKTILIEKKSKPQAIDFRPIALTNVYYKIFMGIIKNKIEDHIKENNKINDFQAGSTKDRSIADNLFLLKHCVEQSYKLKKTLVHNIN